MRLLISTALIFLAGSYVTAKMEPEDDCYNASDPGPSNGLPIPTSAPGSSFSIGKESMIKSLKIIAPASAADPCIPAVKAEGQCRSASQAAEPLIRSFYKYNITSKPEIAAVLSLIAFESEELKYNKNVFPGRPGQGTRNMQMPKFNVLYAKSIPEVAVKLGQLSDRVTDILDLLLSSDDYDFGSAAWFLASQCSTGVRIALQSGSEEGWSKYLTECVDTPVTEERKGYWETAMNSVNDL